MMATRNGKVRTTRASRNRKCTFVICSITLSRYGKVKSEYLFRDAKDRQTDEQKMVNFELWVLERSSYVWSRNKGEGCDLVGRRRGRSLFRYQTLNFLEYVPRGE